MRRLFLFFHHYLLLGEWKAVHPRYEAPVRATIDPGEIRFSLDTPGPGGVFTTRKAFEGNFVIRNDSSISILVRRYDSVLASVLGFETEIVQRSNRVAVSTLTGRILCSSPTVLVVNVSNRIRTCKDRSTTRLILHRIIPKDKNPSTPIPIFLIGQFTGFCVSHWLDLVVNYMGGTLFHR
jgi:hypothetical protein